MEGLRPLIHLLLHFAVPGLLARWRYSAYWLKAWLLLMLSMAIDLDHLLAQPMYDPNRCSIGFHPLHTNWAAACYALLYLIPQTRIVALGLLLHLGLDQLDCIWMRHAG